MLTCNGGRVAGDATCRILWHLFTTKLALQLIQVSRRKIWKLEIFTSSVSYLSFVLFVCFMLNFEIILYLIFYVYFLSVNQQFCLVLLGFIGERGTEVSTGQVSLWLWSVQHFWGIRHSPDHQFPDSKFPDNNSPINKIPDNKLPDEPIPR